MSESRRDPKHFSLLRIKRTTYPMSKRWPSLPDIDGNVKNLALNHSNQLTLSRGWQLIVKAP